MSLDWTVDTNKTRAYLALKRAEETGGENYEAMKHDYHLTVQTLCFALANIGIAGITESNWRDVFQWIYVHERVNGAGRYKGGDKLYVTVKEVYDFIGLRTNVREEPKSRRFHNILLHAIDRAKQELHEFTPEGEDAVV